jgi:tRNA G18 (ribose-2'-O)-methylase SpoU
MGTIQLIIDNIRSASNIGSIFRTADAFKIEKIYICGISATPPNKEILKTALGATESVSWEYHEDIHQLLGTLHKDKTNQIVAIEQSETSIPLNTFHPVAEKNIFLVLGNEVEGVDPVILQQVDTILEIPQFGLKKSLNVSVAAGIAIWEIFSKTALNKPIV